MTEQGEVVSFKYANRGTAAYQTELLAASVLEHSLKSEREQALVPTAEFDEAMEALSGAAHAAYRRLVGHPGLVGYFQAAVCGVRRPRQRFHRLVEFGRGNQRLLPLGL